MEGNSELRPEGQFTAGLALENTSDQQEYPFPTKFGAAFRDS
jgi:hypothetical protein